MRRKKYCFPNKMLRHYSWRVWYSDYHEGISPRRSVKPQRFRNHELWCWKNVIPIAKNANCTDSSPTALISRFRAHYHYPCYGQFSCWVFFFSNWLTSKYLLFYLRSHSNSMIYHCSWQKSMVWQEHHSLLDDVAFLN